MSRVESEFARVIATSRGVLPVRRPVRRHHVPRHALRRQLRGVWRVVWLALVFVAGVVTYHVVAGG